MVAVLALTLFSSLAHAAAVLAAGAGLDPAFGSGGVSRTPLGTASRLSVELGIGPDGSATVGSLSSYLVRFGPQGEQVEEFGDQGKLSLTPDPIGEGVAGLSIIPSNFVVDGAGRVVAFGRQSDYLHTYPIPNTAENQTATESEPVVLRFDQAGHLDPSFGGGSGFVHSAFGLRSAFDTDLPLTAATVGRVDSKNRPVLVVGAAALELGCHAGGVAYLPAGLVRLTEAGSVDRPFGRGGVAPISGSTGSPGLGIDLADRPALGLGPFLHPRLKCPPRATTLARFRADGARAGGFGSNGIVTLRRNLSFGFATPAGAMVLDHRSGGTLQVVRVGLSGRPDGGFGDHGTAKVKLPFGASARVRPVGVDAKGRIILAGVAGANGPYPVLSAKISRPPTFAVGRLLRDGRLDRSFGKGGWALGRVPGADEIGVNTAALDPQGRLLLAATVTAPGRAEGGYLLARFLLGP